MDTLETSGVGGHHQQFKNWQNIQFFVNTFIQLTDVVDSAANEDKKAGYCFQNGFRHL